MYEKNNDINRRVFFIGGGMLILSSFLFSRLWNLQVTDRDKYLLLSDKNRIRITPLFPKRGIFYDRNGNELALNSTNFKLSYQSGISLTDQSIIEKIGKELRLNNNQVKNISKKILNNDFNKIEIKENLTLDEIYALNSINMDLDSFLIEDNSLRALHTSLVILD